MPDASGTVLSRDYPWWRFGRADDRSGGPPRDPQAPCARLHHHADRPRTLARSEDRAGPPAARRSPAVPAGAPPLETGPLSAMDPDPAGHSTPHGEAAPPGTAASRVHRRLLDLEALRRADPPPAPDAGRGAVRDPAGRSGASRLRPLRSDLGSDWRDPGCLALPSHLGLLPASHRDLESSRRPGRRPARARGRVHRVRRGPAPHALRPDEDGGVGSGRAGPARLPPSARGPGRALRLHP